MASFCFSFSHYARITPSLKVKNLLKNNINSKINSNDRFGVKPTPTDNSMTYLLKIEGNFGHEAVELRADSESMLEELSARIKTAFELPYTDHGDHEFNFRAHKYVPSDEVDATREMMFETWDPDPEYKGEEPDWFEMYQSSDIPLSEAFTVLGSTIVYTQGGFKARIELVGREETPADDDRFDKYDYLQDQIR